MKIMVTGAAGFIGAALCQRLLARGDDIIGVDNLNDYYDVTLKTDRLALVQGNERFSFRRHDVADRNATIALFAEVKPERVVHLAAQAGVRYSLENPHAYVDANVVGFTNILEGCRRTQVRHLVFASSSSVYGANTRMPFSVHHTVDHQVSFYGVTKKANELMAHAYSHLYNLPATGLRFFTVYGPWGRPDMSLFTFTRNIIAGEPIDVYNNGRHKRDFTFIDDIIEGLVRVVDKIPESNCEWAGEQPDPATSLAPFRLYNIGNNQPVALLHYIELLEQALGRDARKNFLPLQPGDVPETCADVSDLQQAVGYAPSTPIDVGIKRFVDWYRDYYQVNE